LLEYVILGLLLEKPRHAYDLLAEFKGSLGQVCGATHSRVYGAVRSLEERGWAVSETVPQGNRPPRKVFRITTEGRDEFLRWVQTPVPARREIRDDFLSRLMLAQNLHERLALSVVEEQRKVCQSQLSELEASAQAVEGSRFFKGLALRAAIMHTLADLAFLDWCEEQLRERLTSSGP